MRLGIRQPRADRASWQHGRRPSSELGGQQRRQWRSGEGDQITMFRLFRNRVGARWRRIVVVPVVIGAILFAAAAPASAAPMSVSFKLVPTSAVTVCTDVQARIPTNQYDTWGYLYNGAHARVELWGDDPVWDDHLFTSGWAYLNAPTADRVSISGSPTGIVVQWQGCYLRGLFDEDVEVDDELYVKVTVIDGAGYTLARANSNVVSIGYIVN
jgi:hypothetical protein